MLRLSREAAVEPLPEHPVRETQATAYKLPQFDYRPVGLGRVDSISAGALATAALYLLLRLPGLEMEFRMIDHDLGAISNLNRYLLLRASILGVPKVEALERYATDALAIEGVALRFDRTTLHEIGPLAPRVVVGVDDIAARWLVQEVAEGWVGVAASSHFEAVVSEHNPDSPCVSCLHPYDEPGLGEEIPTISFVSALTGFFLAYRLIRSGAEAANPSQTLMYPFNLSGSRPVWDLALSPHPACKVGCAASARAFTGNGR
jgi:hypothetical protein